MHNGAMSIDNRHALATPYWANPHLRFFAAPADGGGKGKADDDEDDDDDDDDDPDEGKSVDDLKAELKTVRDALSKSKGSSKRNLRRRRELEAQLADAGASSKPKGKKKADDDDDDEPVDVDAIRKAAKAEAKAEADRERKADKVELALARAGVDSAKLKRATRLIDLDDLDLDDDGTVEGLEEAIAELKDEMPELFATPRKRRSVAGKGDRDGDDPAPKTKDASKLQAAALLGKG